MNTTGNALTAVLTEIQVAWGEDTRCTTCLCDLPAGATACEDGDGPVCEGCSAEPWGEDFNYAEWVGQRVRAARALKAIEEESVRMIEAAAKDSADVLAGKA